MGRDGRERRRERLTHVFDRADAAFTGVVTIGFAVDNPEGITIIAEEYNPNAQLAIGNIGNWQHFHIGNTFILPFLPKMAEKNYAMSAIYVLQYNTLPIRRH